MFAHMLYRQEMQIETCLFSLSTFQYKMTDPVRDFWWKLHRILQYKYAITLKLHPNLTITMQITTHFQNKRDASKAIAAPKKNGADAPRPVQAPKDFFQRNTSWHWSIKEIGSGFLPLPDFTNFRVIYSSPSSSIMPGWSTRSTSPW